MNPVIQRAYEILAFDKDRSSTPIVDTFFMELNRHELERIFYDLVATSTEAASYKPYLPRAFELYEQGDRGDFHRIGWTLHDFHWQQWPDEEVEVIRECLMLCCEATLVSDPDAMDYVFIDALLDAGEELDSYLDLWLSRAPVSFAQWITRSVNWQKANEKMLRYITQPQVTAALENAFFGEKDEDDSGEISAAVTFIHSLKALHQRRFAT